MTDDTANSAWKPSGASSASGGPDNRLDQEFASLAPELSRRIGSILETIQRDAERMLDQARFEGRPEIEAPPPVPRAGDDTFAERRRRLEQLSDALIARSEEVLTQLDETARLRESFAGLMNALADAADRIAEEARRTAALPAPQAFPPPAPPPPTELQAPAPLFASTTQPAPPPPSPTPPAPSGTTGVDRAWVDARQAAIHMAAAGNTRGQVELQLREFLGVTDPMTLLDQVFGAGTGPDSRVPWAIAPATPLRPQR